MIQSANKYPISNVFSIDTNVKYTIPKYQREYIWKRENWEKLFNDLMDNDKGYFIGSLICVNKQDDPLSINLEIIDGQQRLATISLFYAAIYHKLMDENRNDDEFITERTNLKKRLIQKDDLRIELQPQNNNFVDYKAVLSEIGLIKDHDKPQYLGVRRIYKAYQYFKDQLSRPPLNDFLEVQKLLEKINSALIVMIQVNNHSDAFMLFESLNSRGVPLSAVDLVKNDILSEMEKRKITTLNSAYAEWEKLVKNLSPNKQSDPVIQERFLRQYYNAFRYKERVKIVGISRATRSTLIKIYEELIKKRNVGEIFNDLIDKSLIYSAFITDEPKHLKENIKKGLIDLLHIGAAPSYTFLLYLFSEHREDTAFIEDSIDFLVKYFVRRNLTDFPATRELDLLFMGLIDECEKNKGNLSQIIVDYLTNSKRFSSTEKFKEKLNGNIYEDNTDVTRFILCKITEKGFNKEIYTDFWEKHKEKYVWTIEHIFPEGENIPKWWVDMIANGDKKEAKRLQVEWVHKIGNLTLTGYNPSLFNSPFLTKRDKDKKGISIGYKNGLYLNRDLAKMEKWTAKDIEERTNKLVKEALGLFKVGDEVI